MARHRHHAASRAAAASGGGVFVRPRETTPPGAGALHASGELARRAEAALDLLAPCTVCPRPCRGVDRLADEVGACRIGRHARVVSAFAHPGEEDVLRGHRGSGTIFFSGCNLRCVFCQNADISQQAAGREVGPTELAGLMLDLQAQGCHNLNLVTPEHVVPQVLEALPHAIEGGLAIPIVSNTSAYDGPESLALLEGVVDVYMPDLKLRSPTACRRLLGVADYGQVATAAVTEMHRQVGDLVVDEDGLARRGLLVRHLVMPGLVEESRAVMGFLAGLSADTYVNVMGQYRPAWKVASTDRYPDLDRPVAAGEVAEARRAAREAGLWRLDEG
ncbi:MAG: radical SAM protein [Actinomycetota bacterium]